MTYLEALVSLTILVEGVGGTLVMKEKMDDEHFRDVTQYLITIWLLTGIAKFIIMTS